MTPLRALSALGTPASDSGHVTATAAGGILIASCHLIEGLASPQGLLLPLCASGTCTLREAVIVSSVLRRVSVPVLHSAAALLRMAEMPYSGTTSFFIRVLLDKKYALPYRVVDALVDHFVRFRREERTLPVVWHQALLCFVQRRGPARVMPLHACVIFTHPATLDSDSYTLR